MARAQPAQDAIALLKADHRTVEELFEKYKKATSSAQKKKLTEEICTELVIHMMLEEEIFYPACRGKIEDDKLDECYVEHDTGKLMIAEIMHADPRDEFYDAKVHVLSEEIEHHVKEEEERVKGIFSQARHAGIDMDTLGKQLADRKDELTKQFARTGLPLPQTSTLKGEAPDQGDVPG